MCDEVSVEIASATADRDAAQSENNSLVQRITHGRQEIETLELDAAEVDEMLSETQTALQTATSGVMTISIDVARAEQKFEALSATMQQQQRDQSQREAAVAEVRAQAQQGRNRIDELKLRVLDATNRLASLQWDAEKSAAQLKELAQTAADVREENREILKASEVAMKEAMPPAKRFTPSPPAATAPNFAATRWPIA